METIIDFFLPLSLAFIMFSLGLGLVPADFRRVASQPVGFAMGALGQLIMLPLVAVGIIALFGLSGAVAVGVMILALSPGGVTSNLMTKLARGDVALSVSLTAIISLIVVITVPLALGPIMGLYMGDAAPEFSILSTAITMFAIVAVPVGLGVLVRALAPSFSVGFEPVASLISTVLFVVIVVGALAAFWDVFAANLVTLGPALITLNILMLAIGYGLSRAAGVGSAGASAISIETGIQNATLGIAVAGIVAGQASGDETFSAYALASGVYGITMYAVSVPFVLWRRARG